MEKEEIAKKIYELSSHINKEPCHMNNQVKGLFLILRYIDDSDGKVIAEDIREYLHVSSARISIALSTLSLKKYITRKRSSLDKRKTIIKITEEGKKALYKENERVISNIEKLISSLSDDEQKEFLYLITKIIKGGTSDVKTN